MLAKEGCKIVIADIDHTRANELASSLTSQNFQALFIDCDVTSTESILKAASIVRSHFGKASILVNNSGFFYQNLITEKTQEQVEKIFKVNIINKKQAP